MHRTLLQLLCLLWIVPLACAEERSKKPVIKEIVPSVFYPIESTNDTVELKIFGENFGASADTIGVRFGKYGRLSTTTDQTANPTNVLLELVDDSQINLVGVRVSDVHPRVSVQISKRGESGEVFSEPFTFLVSKVSKITPVTVAAVTSLLVLALPILFLMRRGEDAEAFYRVAGRDYNVLAALFLDPETDTFSLSKFQFYVWTVAVVFGYVYLTVARSLVQGVFEFANIPANVPGIVFISATTAVAAQGVTSSRGPKGAGSIHPSFADLVTTGGQVAPERFQFFVWTCIGVIAFIFMVVMHDPASITELPAVPKDFLYLMGLSSFGYLGGKMARKPGPIIDDIRASFSSLVLEIQGRNLSKDASFQIDGKPVTLQMIQDDRDPGLDLTSSGSPPGIRILEPETKGATDGYAKLLELKILEPHTEWFSKECQLTIINPDGQKAAWPFEYKGKFDIEIVVTPGSPTKEQVTKASTEAGATVTEVGNSVKASFNSPSTKTAALRKFLEGQQIAYTLKPLK